MPRSSFPSTTRLRERLAIGALLAGAALAAGCGDDGNGGDVDASQCGPGGAPADGLTLTVDGETVTYGGFTSSVNNDCTIAGSGVISVSIHATQVSGTGSFTLCLPRPDLLGAAPVPLAPTRLPPQADDRVQLIDSSATLSGGCTLARDPVAPPSATVTFTGYCAGGTDPAGYALGMSGTIGVTRTCAGNSLGVSAAVAGTVAVAVQ
ncbi:MAG TPA: hypothetical protein VHE35_02765 [Kofleriaceae bacterium]|nr:hypothetical protein [Kofleriaceae bacterium]